MTAAVMHLPPRLETTFSRETASFWRAPPTATSLRSAMLAMAGGFLKVLIRERHIVAAVADHAAYLLGDMASEISALPLPRISGGPDGMVGMTWENGEHHFNVEVFSDGHSEFFYESLVSGELWEEELMLMEKPSTEALDRLRRTLPA